MTPHGLFPGMPRGAPGRVIAAASLALALVAAVGCSSASPMAGQAERPAAAADAGHAEGMPVLIVVDTGENPLGAFELVLRYDPAVVMVTAVTSASPAVGQAAFPASPMSNPSTYRSGHTPILGFQTAGAVMTGRVPVAVARVDAVKTGVSSLSVSVKALYDPEGAAIPGTAAADPDSVHVK